MVQFITSKGHDVGSGPANVDRAAAWRPAHRWQCYWPEPAVSACRPRATRRTGEAVNSSNCAEPAVIGTVPRQRSSEPRAFA